MIIVLYINGGRSTTEAAEDHALSLQTMVIVTSTYANIVCA